METKDTARQKRKRTVLLVEDHKYNLLVLKKMLERLGINVIPAENGKIAVEICRNTNDLDLVLMDLKMPVMDGYHAMMEIKKIRPGIKVIAETAYALAGDDKKILAAGFDDYLAKPITKESLEAVLDKNLP
ncbi:MAG: response regulator [Bacteroidales bacterium]|jgi:CheY-like chemotaxis protein